MKTTQFSLGVGLALMLIGFSSQLRADPPSKVTDDTKAAIAALAPVGTTIATLEYNLGLPGQIKAVDKDTEVVTYFGVYCDINRLRSPSTLVLKSRGDFYPGSATVRFTIFKGKVAKVSVE